MNKIRRLLLVGGILAAVVSVATLLLAFTSSVAAASGPSPNLSDLKPDFDYAGWYAAATGHDPRTLGAGPLMFGAYAFAADGATLYLGFGTARPAENDGALLATYDALNDLQARASLNEQGFVAMQFSNGRVYIPGADPCCGELLSDCGQSGPYQHEWDWGNAYVYAAPGPITRHRNLTNTIHTWALWHAAPANTLYAATSGHMGDWPPPDQVDEHWTGRVFVSRDDGDNWIQLADLGDGVGDYRTYDILGLGGKLYIVWSDLVTQPSGQLADLCGLATSADGGLTWTRAPEVELACRVRLAVVGGKLVGLRAGRDGLVVVDGSGAVTAVPFPNFRAGEAAYNYLATGAADRVYVLTDDGRVMRATDASLTAWEPLVSTDLSFIAIAHWPAAEQIVLSDRGVHGRIWTLDPAAPALSLPAVPGVTISCSDDAIRLDMSQSGSYHVYRSTSPYFLSNQYNRILTADGVDHLIDNNIGGADVIGDVANNYFYLVRAANADGLSPNSALVGEFDFTLQH